MSTPSMSTPSWVKDPFLGSRAVAEANAAALDRDRARLEAAIASAAPAELATLVTSVAEVPGVVEWLADLLRDTPDDLWLNTITAQAYVVWAWEARTGSWAKDVTPLGWEGFRTRAAAAADIVAHTRARHTEAAPIGLPAMRVALAGQGEPGDIHRALAEAASAYPDDFGCARAGVEYFAAKWHGSNAEMWDYALARSQASPDGSPTAAITAAAAVEQLLFAKKDKGALPGARIAELLDEAAARTVDHPDWAWTPSAWAAVNELVVANMHLAWDMDGTLIDSTEVVPDAFVAAVAELGGPVLGRSDIVAAYHVGVPEEMLRHLLGRDLKAGEAESY